MMATLLFLAGYLAYIACMVGLSYLLFTAAMSVFPSAVKKYHLLVCPIIIVLPFVLKNMLWLALFSEFPSTLPSNFSNMIAALLGLAGYLVYIACMMGLSLLVLVIDNFVLTLRPHPEKKSPDWIFKIILGFTFVVIDMFMKRPGVFEMKSTLLFLPGYLAYIACMVGLSYLMFTAAMSIFPSTAKKYNLLVCPIIIVLPFVLKNMLWLALFYEFPSTLPSSFSEMIASLLGVASYLVYIACMMGLSLLVLIIDNFVLTLRPHPAKKSPDWIFKIILGTTFVVMDMFMKGPGVYEMKGVLLFLAGYLAGMIAMPLLALLMLLFLVVLLFLVIMGLGTCVTLLLPSATYNYPKLMFASIVALTFTVTKNMFDTSVDKSALISESFSTMPSIFSDMKATLLGLAGFIYNYRIAYLVMRYLTILALALLLLVSNSMTMCTKYAKAAIIITLGVVLTMRLPGTPIEQKLSLTCESPSTVASSTLVLGDFDRFTEAMRVEHKMAMEKLIEESKATIHSLVIHMVLILVTLLGGMVYYIRDQYLQLKNFVLNHLTFGMLRKKRPETTLGVHKRC